MPAPEFIAPLVFVIAAGLVVVAIRAGLASAKGRQDQMLLVARQLGFEYMVRGAGGCLGTQPMPGVAFEPARLAALVRTFEGFEPFGRGDSRRAGPALAGRRGDIDWYFFDYQYETGSGDDRTTHHHKIGVARIPFTFSPMTLRPENFLDRIGSALGLRDIEFESEEFNRAFRVNGEDRKAAYDLLHPKAMEYLLGGARESWQFGGPFVLIADRGSLSPGDIHNWMAMVGGFLDLIPDYVRQDRGFNQPWSNTWHGILF